MSNSKEEKLKIKIAKIEKDPYKIARLIKKAAEIECEEDEEDRVSNSCDKIMQDFVNYSCDLLESAGDEEAKSFKLASSMRGWACFSSKDGIKEGIKTRYTGLHKIIKNEDIKKRIKEKYDECIDNIEKMK